MIKAVLDTNQFVSSILTKQGASNRLLQAWREHYYILITSIGLLNEIKRVLSYPHIRKKYNLQNQDGTHLVNLVEHESVVLFDSIKVDVIKSDPSDNKVIACAVEGTADYIVSGDKHLLALKNYDRIHIVTVNEFLAIIEYPYLH